jgi:hypothetical protein
MMKMQMPKSGIAVYILFVFLMISCQDNKPENNLAIANGLLPFKAMYSADFVPGKQSDVIVILNVFKAWEKNDMKVIKASFTDSVELYFPTGDIFKSSMDSFIKIADTYYRDSLSKKEITMYAWSATHSVDRNEDWVNIWYKEVDEYKTGRIDSIELQDDNLMKNGKIAKVYSHMRQLKP